MARFSVFLLYVEQTHFSYSKTKEGGIPFEACIPIIFQQKLTVCQEKESLKAVFLFFMHLLLCLLM
jgi:hypothetical protein